jgi:hypothetical protein
MKEREASEFCGLAFLFLLDFLQAGDQLLREIIV